MAVTLCVAAIILSSGCVTQRHPVKRNPKTHTLAGGWSEKRKPTQAELKLYRQVTRGTAFAKYKPHGVSSQVVAGINYRFYTPDGKSVTVYRPADPNKPPRIIR